MTLAEWLACALADIDRRNLPELRPVLEALERATASLRRAPWNAEAGRQDREPHGDIHAD
jgi:hypothetical protein